MNRRITRGEAPNPGLPDDEAPSGHLPVALGSRQEAGHALAGHELDVLRLQADQLAASEPAPETQEQ